MNLPLSLVAVFACGLGNVPTAERWERVPIANAEFRAGSGCLGSPRSGNSPLFGPVAIDREIGNSNWHGRTHLAAGADFRSAPEIEVNYTRHKVAFIHWDPATVSASRAPAWLWNTIPGARLQPRRSYVFTVEVDAGVRLAADEWRQHGFSIALHTGTSASQRGAVFVDSLAAGVDLRVEDLPGTVQRLHLHFHTTGSPPGGDLGLVIAAAPAESAAGAAAISHYLLHAVSLMISVESEAPISTLSQGTGAGGDLGVFFPAALPFSSPEKMVSLASSTDSLPASVVPEPTVIALLAGVVPLATKRLRRRGEKLAERS